MHKITQCVRKFCQKISLLSTFLKSYFSNKFYTKMVKYAPQSSSKVYQLLILELQTSYQFLLSLCFLVLFLAFLRDLTSGLPQMHWPPMFTPTGFLYVPLPCTHNFEKCQQMAKFCTMKNSSKCNLEHILVQAIQTQTLKFSQENFMSVFS